MASAARGHRPFAVVRSRLALALLVLALPVLVSACTIPAVPPLRRVQDDFSPVGISNHQQWQTYFYDGFVCGHPLRVDPAPPPAGSLLVGYDDLFHPDSGPFACIAKLDAAYRGGFRFDLSALTGLRPIVIEKATLTWTIERSLDRSSDGSGVGWRSGAGATNCLGALLESKRSIFVDGFLPGNFLANAFDQRGGVDVTEQVTRWILNGAPNNGFVLKGQNERFGRDNAACMSIVGALRLHITYLRA